MGVNCRTEASQDGGDRMTMVVNMTATVIVTINGTVIRTVGTNGEGNWGDWGCTILDHGLPEWWTNAEDNCDHDVLIT